MTIQNAPSFPTALMSPTRVALARLGVLAMPILSLLMLACLLPAPARGADWNLDQLMQSLARAKPGRADFTETKTLSILDRPLESSGELSYLPPDRLEKRTTAPKPETLIVKGNLLRFERGQQKHTLQLQDSPELAGYIDSIRGTLAGDRATLERHFRLSLEGSPARWTLSLFPIEQAMARSVHLIRISGAGDEVRSMEVIQTDGDRSLTTIRRRPSR